MIIKIDIDGVIRDLVGAMCTLYNEDYGTNLTPSDVTEYDVNKVFTKCENASEYFFKEHSSYVFNSGALVYHKVRLAITKLRQAGHKIVLVSWLPSFENKIDTLEFLKSQCIYYDDICFTGDKHLVNGDILIDDNPKFIQQCCDKETTFLINQPYNTNSNVECTTRFNSLNECVDYIIENM